VREFFQCGLFLIGQAGFEGVLQATFFQRYIPTFLASAQVGASTGFLPCFINFYPPIGRSNDTHHLPLGAFLSTTDTGSLWYMFVRHFEEK
jgi:hypothetical protein